MNFKMLISSVLSITSLGILASCAPSVQSQNPNSFHSSSASSSEESNTETSASSPSPYPYQNKTAVFVGDSITYDNGSNDGTRYWELLKKSLQLSEATPMGLIGSSVSMTNIYGLAVMPLRFRYGEIPEADIIFIFMGTNDYGHETPLGTIEDSEDTSFYGAWNYIIPRLQKRRPNSKIVLITPTPRYGLITSPTNNEPFTYDYLPNPAGYSLPDYVNAIKDIGAKYSLPVIDLYAELSPKLDLSKSEDKSAYFPDGLHPNTAGYKLIADIIEQYLIENPLF